MGECWYRDCCIAENPEKVRCNLGGEMSGDEKILEFLTDLATERVLGKIFCSNTVCPW